MTENRTPAQLADDAAQAIRALNHATYPGKGGLDYAGDAYEVIGALRALAECLAQTVDQLGTFLFELHIAGRLDARDGWPFAGQAGDAVTMARLALGSAGMGAVELAGHLAAAQNDIAGLDTLHAA